MTSTISTDQEQLLTLSDGRTLAFEHAGNPASTCVVIFFAGTLSVGTVPPASRFPPSLVARDAHYLAPTNPGYGRTSPPSRDVTYAATIAGDISVLLDHFYPRSASESEPRTDLELYIAGGSFGTVPAQMLYGASPSLFPHAYGIRGLLLLGPLLPFAHCTPRDPQTGFSPTEHMSWQTYLSIGPLAKPRPNWPIIPERLVQRLTLPVLKRQFLSTDTAQKFLRQQFFDDMDEREKSSFARWRKEKGYEDGQLERELAEGIVRSVQVSWEGFLCSAEVLYSEWWGGRRIEEVEADLSSRGSKVLIVVGDKDSTVPPQWGEYLKGKYHNADIKIIPGGHLSAIFYMDEIWEQFFAE